MKPGYEPKRLKLLKNHLLITDVDNQDTIAGTKYDRHVNSP